MRPSRTGFTLIEIMIVLLILSVVMLGFTEAVLTSTKTHQDVATYADLENDAHQLLDRIADRIREGGTSSPDWDLVCPPGLVGSSGSLTYNPCSGASIVGTSGTIQWGSALQVAVIPGSGEAIDGIDINGDGRADEQVLVVRDPATGDVVETWGRDVKSLNLSESGGQVTIELILERINPEGLPVTVKAVTVVSPRN